MIVVSNASPLIIISKLKLFSHLPALYETVIIPTAVFKEVALRGAGRPGAAELNKGLASGFIVRQQAKNTLAVTALSKFFGAGESEAIILASEIGADAVILDDNKARSVADSMSLHVVGTIGILLDMRRSKVIPKIKPYLDSALLFGFRISHDLYVKILRTAGE